MATYSIKRTLFAITLSVIAVGCVREADQQPLEQDQENLHEVVFHAGWAPETKTVLQEDGSVWWSPGDEISLFVGGGENGGYRLTSTNTDPTATADFLGQICESESTFSAVYPYDSRNYFDGTHFGIFLNGEQVAKEGSFANQSLVSIAQSTDNNLYFRNVCGGIKFSVANEGITKLYLHTVNGTIGGHLEYVLDENGIPQFSGSGPYGGISDLTVWAPEHGTFEPGKYYYIVLPAKIITNGLSITFYKGDDCAVWSYPHSVEIHRSAFKRLKNVDEGLTFHKTVYDNAAKLYSFLPNEIDKQRITGIKFHVKDDTITEHQLIASVPVNYNVDGTTVNIYTTAELFDISDVTPNMFKGYSALQTLDLSKTIVPSAGSLSRMFQECISLESIIFGDWDTRKVQSMDMMFTRCEMLRTLDLSFMNTDNVTSMLGIFGDCKTLTSLNISSFNTFNITEMRGMFGGCRALLSLDVSSFDTSNVTDMGGMFGSCCSLESLDLSSFNTANVTDMHAMFEGCASLKTLDLSFFNTSNVKTFESMFYGCANLESLDLTIFNTSKAESMYFMFGWCTSLKYLDVSSFTSESLQRAGYMFGTCKRLQKLNLGAFDISQADCPYIGEAMMRTSKSGAIRCIPETKTVLEATMDNNLMGRVTWFSLSDDINTFEYQRDPNLYYSSDFSKHETVKKLYSATQGKGIDIVLMGDAYSDRMIANGQYDVDMELAADAIFAKEPMASFKEYFNVYIVYLVSDNEVLGESTALNGGVIEDGLICMDGNVWAQVPEKYRILATGNGDFSVQEAIVIVNGAPQVTGYATLTARFENNNYYDCDFGWGYASAVVSRGDHNNTDAFKITVAHEFGHSFAKLADEYVGIDALIEDYDASLITDHFNRFGWYKNVDLTSDSTTIRWSQFLNDDRYENDGVGIYEGGALYSHGVWRPSENSIMRTGTEFNAPSRAAIYNRIHKLAFGKDWQFDYEEFVQWDQKNFGIEKRTTKADAGMMPPHFKNKPFVHIQKNKTEDGLTEINVIMN